MNWPLQIIFYLILNIQNLTSHWFDFQYFFALMIATGLDVTFRFDWITDERKQLAMNQTTSIIIWNIYDGK